MANVAVICAYNPGNNGMATVDRAARQVLRDEKVPFTLINVQRLRKRDLLKPFVHLRELERLRSFTHIVYWGDFVNNPLYGMGDFLDREVWKGYSESEGRRYWIDTFLDAAEHLGDSTSIASIGNCFLGADSHASDSTITDAFGRFCRSADLIIPREDWSLKVVETLGGVNRGPRLFGGVDAAFLGHWRQREAPHGSFSYCFHRSKVTVGPADIRGIEALTGLESAEIPWTDTGVRLHRGLRRSIRRIQRSHFVITDVYHVCINAINLGIPVVCVSNPESGMAGTLSDAKKIAMLESLGAEDYLLEVEPGAPLLQGLPDLKRIWDMIRHEGGLKPQVRTKLAERRTATRKALTGFIEG